MRLLVPRETRPGERRVAVVPSVVGKFKQLGFEVLIESGAGDLAFASDGDYSAAGALVVPASGLDDALAASDVIASVRPLEYGRAKRLKPGAVAVSFLSPGTDIDTVRGLQDAGATGLSFDLVPRISRAQSMDALGIELPRLDMRHPGAQHLDQEDRLMGARKSVAGGAAAAGHARVPPRHHGH